MIKNLSPNSLEIVNPELAKQWHPTLNGDLKPDAVTFGSHKKVWWLCDKNHEWEAVIGDRSNGSGCGVCSGNKVLIGFNDLQTLKPDLAAQWHPILNGDLKPDAVTFGSHKKVWWLCGKDHEWEASVHTRSSGNGCGVCSGKRVLAGFNDLQTLKPDLAAQWHPILNGDLKPDAVTFGSHKKVWWLCELGHEFLAIINDRSNGNGCGVCSGKQVLVGVNDLQTLKPELVIQWHSTLNGDLKPEDFTIGSHKKVWWICDKGHEWKTIVKSRSKGDGCPVCSGQKVLIGFNDLQTLKPIVAAQWHPILNGDLKPEDFTIGSHKKVWWLCDKEHKWDAFIFNRSRGFGCPKCANLISKGETQIANYIKSFGLRILQSNRKILKGQEIDIYIPEKKIAIEFNGTYWHDENHKDKNYHYDKWLACKNLGIQLIQIWEDDWNKNPELIKKSLAHKLNISQDEKVFARKTIVVILNTKQVKEFLSENHIQGFASGSYYVGLNDINNKTQAVLVLKKELNNSLNIIRYATSKNVIGGFTKLLKFAEREYRPSSFITFADHTISDGGLYENNGFVPDKEIGPDYMYVVKNERKHKFGYRLKRFKNDPDLLWNENLTERELAILNNLPRIWDAGKTKYKLIINDYLNYSPIITL